MRVCLARLTHGRAVFVAVLRVNIKLESDKSNQKGADIRFKPK